MELLIISINDDVEKKLIKNKYEETWRENPNWKSFCEKKM